MAFILTDRNKSLKDQIGINPQAILQIEGMDTVFGSQAVLVFARWDASNIKWDDGTRWDGYVEKEGSFDVIDLSKGTTTNISQQIYPDRASSGSVSSVNIRLIDINNQVMPKFSFDEIGEILGKKADFYIGFKQGAFREDAIPVFRGVVIDFFTENGAINVTVAHPDTLKRQEIYEQYQSQLTADAVYQKTTIQNIIFEQRNKTRPTLSVECTSGPLVATLDNDVVSFGGGGSAELGEVLDEIRSTSDVNYALDVDLVDGADDETIISTFSATPLTIDTTLSVISTEGLFVSQDSLESYIMVGDEIMRVVSKTDTTIEVERAQFGTIPKNYDSGEEISSFYRITGDPIDLALKLMLSNEGNEFFTSDDKPGSIMNNQLQFKDHDVKDLTGLIVGDKVKIDSVEYTIASFGQTNSGSFIEVDGVIADVPEFTGVFEYKSQYNVLPDGLGMLPFQVDVEGHLDIKRFNPGIFVEYKIDLKDTLDDAKKFIQEQIYFPQGLYAIPRKARSSCKLILPPLSSEVIPTLNTKNITNLDKIKQRRSIHKYHYNVYRVDFELDEVEDKFKRKEILINNNSKQRIKSGNKVLRIEANGFRDTPETNAAILNALNRYKDRYSFAPTYFEGVEVKYSDGFNIEVGDVLPFGGVDTQIVDLQTGKRDDTKKLFEVINKSLNIKNGNIKLDILSTSFNINARYAVFSPASKITSATTTELTIDRIIDTGEFTNESDKWSEFQGFQVRIHSKDYTYDETTIFRKVSTQNVNVLEVDALPSAPPADSIIEIPLYDDQDKLINDEYKLRFSHMTFRGEISGVTSDKVFDVVDASGLFVGSQIVISSPDYTRDTFGEIYTIDDITGSTITLNKDLPFTPLIGDKIENSNYGDGGFPYQLI